MLIAENSPWFLLGLSCALDRGCLGAHFGIKFEGTQLKPTKILLCSIKKSHFPKHSFGCSAASSHPIELGYGSKVLSRRAESNDISHLVIAFRNKIFIFGGPNTIFLIFGGLYRRKVGLKRLTVPGIVIYAKN